MSTPSKQQLKQAAANNSKRKCYNKLRTIVNQRALLNKNNQSVRRNDITAAAFVTLQAFVNTDPSEAQSIEFIKKNMSNIALVARGSWAANLRALQKLINDYEQA